MQKTASLYIHVPFCHGTCDYCDFYSVPIKNEFSSGGDFAENSIIEKYLRRLLLDCGELFSVYQTDSVPTLYIGGGTPSALGGRNVKRLLAGVLSMLPSGKNAPKEITIEANPESADAGFLEAAREAGAGRLSLGVQSFNEASRLAVQRTGDVSILPERLKLAARFFPGAFSADIISGLPFQTKKVLRDDIERLLDYGPSHVSLYALSAEEGTPFFEASRKKMPGLPGESEADSLWLYGRDYLEKRGYAQYEVSNFCPPGNECRHNIRYWRMENWLALGPAASGTLVNEEGGAFRYTVKADLALWLERGPARKPPVTEERLDPLTVMKESLLMGFRYSGGPCGELFYKRFKKSVREAIPKTLASWEKRGFILTEKDSAGWEKIFLDREGLLFLNSFLLDAFSELDGSRS